MPTGIKVKDAMVSPVVTAKPNQSVNEGAKIMQKEDVGSLVICENKHPVGIVTREDIVNKVVAKNLKASEILLKDIMTKKVVSTVSDEDLADTARVMAKYGYERLPVIDNGKLVGIISVREIAKVAPLAMEVLRERLLLTEPGTEFEETNAGECEICGNYSERLHYVNDRWVCDNDKEEAAEL